MSLKIIVSIIFIFVAFFASKAESAVLKEASIKRTKKSAVGPLWPDKKIPYAFSNIIEFDFEDREKIKKVLKQVQESLSINGETCIEFVERHNEKDYILFSDRGDCSSGVGFYPGVNQISLSQECITSGTIIHEIMHRLGFDHEHSRPDRDENVKVDYNNALNKENFEKNPFHNNEIDAPYDFHSVIHYNSNFFQKTNKPTIVSKIPVLISDENEIYHTREKLTPIDIYKMQRLYKCKSIDIPQIVKENDSIEEESVEKIKKRFRLEATFNGISEELIEHYLNKSYNTCGVEHYWPVSYPLVESNHRLYRLMCSRKKQVKESCRFSIECREDDSICVRPFFKKVGLCVRPENTKLNELSQTVNDSMFEYGKKVKDTLGKLKKKIFG